MRFECDSTKDRANLAKHGIGFEEARELLESDADYLELFDEAYSEDEARFIAIGPIQRGVVLVVWTERLEHSIRIISARWATPAEQDLYRRYREAGR